LVARAGVVARARLIDRAGPFADLRDKGFAGFLRELFVTRVLFLITIQSDINKAFAESSHFFRDRPKRPRGGVATPLSY
jgi:hypothetical protein